MFVRHVCVELTVLCSSFRGGALWCLRRGLWWLMCSLRALLGCVAAAVVLPPRRVVAYVLPSRTSESLGTLAPLKFGKL